MAPSLSFLTDIIVSLLLGTGIAIPLIYLNIRLSKTLGLIDWPKARGINEEQVPIVGPSLVLITLAGLIFLGEKHGISSWFICCAAVIAFMGLLDDRRPLAPSDKIFFQLICAMVVVSMDPAIRATVTDPYGVAGGFLAVFFIVGLTNAVNFIDGIDGLAGLVLFCGFGGVVIFSSAFAETPVYCQAASLIMGLLIPFFYTNVFKRRGFLGNTGSYFFSFVASVMHLSLPIGVDSPVNKISIAALCFIVPIADATMVILVRLGTLRSPFQADKGHLHHRLVQSSIPLRYILTNFGMVGLVSAISAGFLIRDPAARNSLFPGFLCVGNVIITSLLILMVERASRMRIYGYFKRIDQGGNVFYVKYKLANKDGTPLKRWQLKRMEALVSSEIRVTDLCAAEEPDQLYITLRTSSEPLRGISGRLENLFAQDRHLVVEVVESGELLKNASGLPAFTTKLSGQTRPRLVQKS